MIMIALRVNPKTKIAAGVPVKVSDVATIMCDSRVAAHDLTLPLPKEIGIWLIDAGAIMNAIYKEYPSERIEVLGDAIGWLQRFPANKTSKISAWFGERVRHTLLGVILKPERKPSVTAQSASVHGGEVLK